MMQNMKISPQRIEEIIATFKESRRNLEMLHAQGQRKNGCIGWPECDCRLAEQIRGIVNLEEEWKTRGLTL